MENKIKLVLQKILGFNNFLFLFAIYSIRRLYKNKYESEFLYFLSLVPDNNLILDIGANIGITVIPLAKKAAKGKVYAFEPIPGNLLALKRVIKYYKLTNVTVFETALGNQSGELDMVMPVVNKVKLQGYSHVVSDEHPDNGDFFTVPLQKLDDIAELKAAKLIGAIKIDVENFEYEVLTGAKQLLLKHKPIIYSELWEHRKRSLTLDYLTKEIGYKVMVFDGKGLVPFTNQRALNFFFVV